MVGKLYNLKSAAKKFCNLEMILRGKNDAFFKKSPKFFENPSEI